MSIAHSHYATSKDFFSHDVALAPFLPRILYTQSTMLFSRRLRARHPRGPIENPRKEKTGLPEESPRGYVWHANFAEVGPSLYL